MALLPQLDTSGPLLPLGHAFVFGNPEERAFLDDRDLEGQDPRRALHAALKTAQEGRFGPFHQLVPRLAAERRRSIWDEAALLFGFAAPASSIRALLNALIPGLPEDGADTLKAAAMRLLAYAGLPEFFEDILRLLAHFSDPQDEHEIAVILDRLLLPEDAGAPLRSAYLAHVDEIAAGDVARTDFIMRTRELMEAVNPVPRDGRIYAGRPLDVHVLAVDLLDRLARPADLTRIYHERLIIEAASGHDLSSFYTELIFRPDAAARALEELFDAVPLDTLGPEARYFFRRQIPR